MTIIARLANRLARPLRLVALSLPLVAAGCGPATANRPNEPVYMGDYLDAHQITKARDRAFLPMIVEDGSAPIPVAAPTAPAAPAVPTTAPTITQPTVLNSLFAALQITPAENYELSQDDTAHWQRRSGSNGGDFACTFQPGNISFSNGTMTLSQTAGSTCAEYRTTASYSYGYYEVRMRPARGNGLMAGSFFTYTGTYEQPDHHEIDIEALGKNCSIQLNHYGRGVGHHERVLTASELGFDPCADFHNYGFAWLPDSITYYIDGRQVHRTTADIPSQPGQLMANAWSGRGNFVNWLGSFTQGQTSTTQYDWIRYAPLNH